MCKFAFQHSLAVFCLSLLFLANIVAADPPTQPCNFVFKCSNFKDRVWSTDEKGEMCKVWQNPCQFASENCRRLNINQKELIEISKEACQEKCSKTACSSLYDPVCAEYEGVRRIFSNQCTLQDHNCRTGETFILYHIGECQ